MSEVRFTFLHGRLTLRKCTADNDAPSTPPPGRSQDPHLKRLAQSKCVRNFEGAVSISTFEEKRYVNVAGERLWLEEGTEVHRSSTGMEVFLWWCAADKVITLWIDDASAHKLSVVQSYMGNSDPPSSDIIARPGNPMMRQRPLSGYRKSLCLVDDSTGEVVSVIKDDLDLHEAPVQSTPTKKSHREDKPGGVLAHKVDDIVHAIHPRHEDSSVDLENPDWSGDSSTEGLLYLNLHQKGPLPPPLVTEATPRKERSALGNIAQDEDNLRIRSASLASVSTVATFRTGLESIHPSATDAIIEPAARVRELSEASVATARPGKEDSSDAILLEFFGAESTMRLSRIRKPGFAPVAQEELKKVEVAETPSLWSYLPIMSVWETISSFASWFSVSALTTDVEKSEAVDARKRRARMSVVYFDTFGHKRKVLMRR